METPFLEEVKKFKGGWLNEAWSLKTPHWKEALMVLNHLLDQAVNWTPVQPYTASAFFEHPPTVDCLVNDLENAWRKRKLTLIDSRSLKPDGISQHSTQNLLDCISSIENKTFDAQSVRYTMGDRAASPTGLEACGPKPITQNLLTASDIIPRGSMISLCI